MIKFAVTRPKDRLKAIAHGVDMLKWHEDPYLKHYGVGIDPNMTVVSILIPFSFLKLRCPDPGSYPPTPGGSVQWFSCKAWLFWTLGSSRKEISPF